MRPIVQDSLEVERQKMAILRIIAGSRRAIGSKVIARLLKDNYGIELSERGVRYHLNLMDERQLTAKVSRRDGRVITNQGLAEIEDAMVTDKVGFVIDRIELLSYQINFNPQTLAGKIPINISLFPQKQLKEALRIMAPAMKAGLCAGQLLAIAREGEKLGEAMIPEGKVGLATVCSLVINGVLLKAGIPIDSRFGGILQFKNHQPLRFTDLIEYSGSSLDPSEIFIAGRMTNVMEAARFGNGKILANFREVPALCMEEASQVFDSLEKSGIKAPLTVGAAGKSVCGVPVGLGKVGLVLVGGLNPVAAVVEAGLDISSKAMSGLVEYSQLVDFSSL
jgi:repressor of nif and glnA expression